MASKDMMVSRAWIAKKLKRYDDMYTCMRAVSQSGESLNKKERTLFYLAYQYLLRPYRDGWYKLLVITDLIDGSRRKMQLTKEYKDFVEKQWTEYCLEAVNTIDSILLPRTNHVRPKIFYLKMRADLTRYLIEISARARRKRLIRETKASYIEASELCEDKLSPTHPLRLAVALNHAVFYAHVQNKKELAITTARAALGEAEKMLDKIESKRKLKKVTTILQLLRDNIAYWTPRGSDEDEINEPILKGESIKEAKMLSRNDYAASTDPKAAAKATTEGKYGRPTLVDEYMADHAAEQANAIANQVIMIESFKSPPPSEELSSTSEEEVEQQEEEEDLEPRVSELLEDEEKEGQDHDEGESEQDEEEEKEEEEEDFEWEGEEGGEEARISLGPTKLVPPDGLKAYVFTPSEDDLLYKKVQQEEEYLAELIASNEAARKRNEELLAIKAAAKETESEFETETVASESTTLLGEKLSDEGSSTESSEAEAEDRDDRYPSDHDQEAEDRLVEQILDEFFKADLTAQTMLDESPDKSCLSVSSVQSITSLDASPSGTTLASSYLSGSTIEEEHKKRRLSRAQKLAQAGEDEEEEMVEEEESSEEEEGDAEEEEEYEIEEPEEQPSYDSMLSLQSQDSDMIITDMGMDDFDDKDDDNDDSGHAKIEEPESELEEEEAEEEEREEEEQADDEADAESSGSKESVEEASKKPKRARTGSIGSQESLSDLSSASSVSPRSKSPSSSSTSSSESTTSKPRGKKSRTAGGDHFHALPPGPKSAFDQRGYVDEFSNVVKQVETSLSDFEFSPDRFAEIDRVLEFLQDQEEKQELAESEGRRFEPSNMNVSDPLVKLMFTDFRIVYPEYDHDVMVGVSIGDEDESSTSGGSEDEADADKGQQEPRISTATEVREEVVAKNEAEDKAEIECLLEYPEDFKDYEEQSFKAEYIKIVQPVKELLPAQQGPGKGEEFDGEGYEEGELEELETILEPRVTVAVDAGAGAAKQTPASIYDNIVTTKSSKSIAQLKGRKSKPKIAFKPK